MVLPRFPVLMVGAALSVTAGAAYALDLCYRVNDGPGWPAAGGLGRMMVVGAMVAWLLGLRRTTALPGLR